MPPKHKTIAELVISEDKYQGEFEMKTYFSGAILMEIFKDGKEVLSFDLNNIEIPLSIDHGFTKDADGLFYVTRGQFKASFGVEPKILLKQIPLSENAKK